MVVNVNTRKTITAALQVKHILPAGVGILLCNYYTAPAAATADPRRLRPITIRQFSDRAFTVIIFFVFKFYVTITTGLKGVCVTRWDGWNGAPGTAIKTVAASYVWLPDLGATADVRKKKKFKKKYRSAMMIVYYSLYYCIEHSEYRPDSNKFVKTHTLRVESDPVVSTTRYYVIWSVFNYQTRVHER